MRFFIYLFFIILFSITKSYACSVNIVNTINFSAYDPLIDTGGKTAQATIDVVCGDNIRRSYNIKINKGSSSSYHPRTLCLSDNSGQLNYNLFTDSAMNNIIGDGSDSTGIISRSNARCRTAGNCRHILYGFLYDNQYLAKYGNYSDTLQITLEY